VPRCDLQPPTLSFSLQRQVFPRRQRCNPTSALPKPARSQWTNVYGYPLVDNYRIQYWYFVDGRDREFEAPFNRLQSVARVYTPNDTAIQSRTCGLTREKARAGLSRHKLTWRPRERCEHGLTRGGRHAEVSPKRG
jgi:hypothetical protein